MKKYTILISILVLGLAISAHAQGAKEDAKEKSYQANPEDVKSIDAIINATYDVISGGIGVKRNWDRFRSLFHPSARLIPTGRSRETGAFGARPLTPQGYIDNSGKFLVNNGFIEKELGRKTEVFGNIAHAFSSYEGTFTVNGRKSTIRGINSFQLMNDGKRWWVMTIFWQGASPNNPIPEKYLKKAD